MSTPYIKILIPKYPTTIDWMKNNAPHTGAGINITDFHNNVASPASKGWLKLNLNIVKEETIDSIIIIEVINNNIFSVNKGFPKLAKENNNAIIVIAHNNP